MVGVSLRKFIRKIEQLRWRGDAPLVAQANNANVPASWYAVAF